MGAAHFHIDSDIARASTLPGSFYTDPAVFAAQKERVFARSWQFLADERVVRERGSLLPVTLLPGCLDEPLLVTRDHEDRLHVLSNVCTHRGNLLATQACTKSSITCNYHGRRFDLDGRFRSMPMFEETIGFPSERDHLARVAFEKLGPFIFASLAPAAPFAALASDVQLRMSWMPLDELAFDAARSREFEFQANWALYCDNFLEGFHIPYLHAALNSSIDFEAYTTELFGESSLQFASAREGEPAFDLPRASPDHGKRIAASYWFLFPNLMLNFYPWGLSMNIVKPLAVDRTRVSFLTYVWKKELLDRGAGSGLDRVEMEDEAVVQAVQRGVRSRFYDRGRYSPSREQGLHHFHRWLANRLAPTD